MLTRINAGIYVTNSFSSKAFAELRDHSIIP